MSFERDVTFTGKIVRKTALAILFSPEDREEEIWLPNSQIQIDGIDGNIFEITIPVWLALEKDLI